MPLNGWPEQASLPFPSLPIHTLHRKAGRRWKQPYYNKRKGSHESEKSRRLCLLLARAAPAPKVVLAASVASLTHTAQFIMTLRRISKFLTPLRRRANAGTQESSSRVASAQRLAACLPLDRCRCSPLLEVGPCYGHTSRDGGASSEKGAQRPATQYRARGRGGGSRGWDRQVVETGWVAVL